MKDFTCEKCDAVFASKYNLARHQRRKNCDDKPTKSLQCSHCVSRFSRRDALARHERLTHSGGGELFFCGMCSKTFAAKAFLLQHRREKHKLRTKFYTVSSAHRRACELFRLNFPNEIVTMSECLSFVLPKAEKLLMHLVGERKVIKAAFVLSLRFAKPDYHPQDDRDEFGAEGSEVITMNLRSLTTEINMSSDRASVMNSMSAHIINTFDDFVDHGSGWVLTDCIHFDVEVGQCAPLNGGCVLHSAEYKKKSIVIKNNTSSGKESDGRCFFYAVASQFLPAERQSSDDFESFIQAQVCENVTVPVALKDVPKFEKANEHLDLSINVLFRSEDDAVFPIYASPLIHAKNRVNLMLFFTDREGEENSEKMHYAKIRDLPNLLASRVESENGNWHTDRKHLCYNCFGQFERQSTMEAHVRWCHKEEGQVFDLPEKGTRIQYEKRHKEFKLGYVFFFDFETYQKTPDRDCSCSEEEKKKCKHKSKIVSEHSAFAYSLLMLDRDSQVVEDIHYVGEDAMHHFLSCLITLEKKYMKKLKEVKPIVMSGADTENFERADKCHICGEKLNKDRVRDHDHINGKYVGAAHSVCNLARRECMKIVGFAHNFSGYDSHIVMSAVAEHEKELRISAIPLNTEKFKMLRIENCVLLDSLAFLGASLEKLVATLKASHHSFPILQQWISHAEKKKLILRKGVYPYEFVTSLEKVTLTHSLPAKNNFFSHLSGQHISQSDYDHAVTVWKAFDCQTMEDYTRLYVRADTYQLAEAMLEMRESVLEEFGIDMCHYLSLPMMAKDIMLRFTGSKMELMSDIEMIQMVRANIRGGLSYVNTRHFKCDEEQEKRGEKVCLAYVDANNLYGAAMRFPLPLDDFQWMTDKQLENFSLHDISEESDRGMILEVTLDYPENLHLTHSSFPLAPHQMEITDSVLSEYAKEALYSLSNKKIYKAKKLTSTFMQRKNYVCHGLNLKLYLELGLKLVSIHRGITFRQSRFLRPYIDMCTKKRAEAVTKTRSNMMKLLCNSLYGKVS